VGFELTTVTSGEKTNETAPGTEPPSAEEAHIDLSRAARGAGPPVVGRNVGTDESNIALDLDPSDDADNQYADDADERVDDGGELVDDGGEHIDGGGEHVDDGGELVDELDRDRFIRAAGKPQLRPASDEVDANRGVDVPAPGLRVDDADTEGDGDLPDADPDGPAPRGLTGKPNGIRRSSQSSRSTPAPCLGRRWSRRSSPAPTLGRGRVRASCHAGLKWGSRRDHHHLGPFPPGRSVMAARPLIFLAAEDL
jgi:hypothetical protein